MCQHRNKQLCGTVHMVNFFGSAPLPIFAQAAQEAPLPPLGTLTEVTEGATACLPACQPEGERLADRSVCACVCGWGR